MIATMAAPNSSMRYSAKPRAISGSTTSSGGREHDADLAAHAAQHDDGEDDGALDEGEALRADEALAGGEERAGEAAEHGAQREGGELGVGRVDAQRLAGDLVLAQRLPGAPDRQAAQAQHDEVGEQGQRQDQEVEEDRCGAGGEKSMPKSWWKAVSPSAGLRSNAKPKKLGPRDVGRCRSGRR